ncbi:MAG: hypothetical protein KAS96_05985, partial [Planctomycetes bacterium]|nr:hypothetical protein [Planctomycetota bacterium]
SGVESGEQLAKILNTSFAIVYIYTGGDHEDEVRARVKDNDLKAYFGKRLHLLMKDNEENSHDRLILDTQGIYNENFSFKFGSMLRKTSRDSIESILVRLGNHQVDFVKQFLGDTKSPEHDFKELLAEKIIENMNDALCEKFKSKEIDENKTSSLLGIIKSKFRDEIKSLDFEDFHSTGDSGGADISSLVDLWSYRLYYYPQDKTVRMGDIIKKDEDYFLVVTPDCNLARFWKKNFGYLNLIPLWEIEKDIEKFKASPIKRRNFKETTPNSMTTEPTGYPGGCYVLPYLKDGSKKLNFIVISKAITNTVIPRLAGPNEKTALDYDVITDYNRVASISEPFLTPLISNILSAILGAGTPDYPNNISGNIKETFEKTCTDLWLTT